jgi:hypothetical protein
LSIDWENVAARAALRGYSEQPGLDIESLRYTPERVTGHWFPH